MPRDHSPDPGVGRADGAQDAMAKRPDGGGNERPAAPPDNDPRENEAEESAREPKRRRERAAEERGSERRVEDDRDGENGGPDEPPQHVLRHVCPVLRVRTWRMAVLGRGDDDRRPARVRVGAVILVIWSLRGCLSDAAGFTPARVLRTSRAGTPQPPAEARRGHARRRRGRGKRAARAERR